MCEGIRWGHRVLSRPREHLRGLPERAPLRICEVTPRVCLKGAGSKFAARGCSAVRQPDGGEIRGRATPGAVRAAQALRDRSSFLRPSWISRLARAAWARSDGACSPGAICDTRGVSRHSVAFHGVLRACRIQESVSVLGGRALPYKVARGGHCGGRTLAPNDARGRPPCRNAVPIGSRCARRVVAPAPRNGRGASTRARSRGVTLRLALGGAAGALGHSAPLPGRSGALDTLGAKRRGAWPQLQVPRGPRSAACRPPPSAGAPAAPRAPLQRISKT